MKLNKIYNMDCLEGLRQLEDNSIDLVLTDPPYNIGKDFENDNLSKEDYLKWCESWITELVRVCKIGGAIYLTLGFQCVAEIKVIFNRFETLRLKNWIVWYRQDGWKSDKGFSHSHEHILYFIKDNVPESTQEEFRAYLNNKRQSKKLTLSDINKTFSWAITGGGCASTYMGDKEDNSLPTLSHYLKLKELLELDNRFDWLPFGVKFNKTDVCDDVWLTPKSEKKRLGHPTQKPEALFRRILTASSNKGDIVLDPFMGSGTTAFACKTLERNFIGIEISAEYSKIVNKRLEQSVLNSIVSTSPIIPYKGNPPGKQP